jgi:hypothetical protein
LFTIFLIVLFEFIALALIAIHVPVIVGIIIGLVFLVIFTFLGYMLYKACMEHWDDTMKQQKEFDKKFPPLPPTTKETLPSTDTDKMVSSFANLGMFAVYGILAILGILALWAITRALGIPIWAICLIVIVFFIIPSTVFSVWGYRQWKKRRNQENNQNQK